MCAKSQAPNNQGISGIPAFGLEVQALREHVTELVLKSWGKSSLL